MHAFIRPDDYVNNKQRERVKTAFIYAVRRINHPVVNTLDCDTGNSLRESRFILCILAWTTNKHDHY